jgi:hypothetical protein
VRVAELAAIRLGDVDLDACRIRIDDALIQPYSGHEYRQSLEVYSRLSLADAQQRYDEVIDRFRSEPTPDDQGIHARLRLVTAFLPTPLVEESPCGQGEPGP